jgi:hypothetical protein
MKLDEEHYKMHDKSLQCASNWFRSKYQALEHSTTHTVTYGAAFPKFAFTSTQLRHASTKLRHFRSLQSEVTQNMHHNEGVPLSLSPLPQQCALTLQIHSHGSVGVMRLTPLPASPYLHAPCSRLAALLQKRDLTYGLASLKWWLF